MITKTIIPKSTFVKFRLPASFVGENVRIVAVVEKDSSVSPLQKRNQIAKTYSKYPKTDLAAIKFDRDEANDFE